MTIKYHSAVLFIKDIEISKDFYCNLLNQEINMDFGNYVVLNNGLTLWQIPDWHALSDDFYDKEYYNRSLELYFETEDIHETVDLVKKNNIPKHHELTEESWGQKTIRIYDPDNNLIEIGEKLESYIKRMHSEGLNIDQICKKSGVPVKLIEEYLK